MEFALQTSGMYEPVLDHARWAVAMGFAAVALPDHYLASNDEETAASIPVPDAFALLAGLARETTGIELSVLVSPITFRHPAVLLKSAVTIDAMSGGRFALGIGTGWLDIEHMVFGFPYPERTVRFEMLEEALRYVRAGLDAGGPGFAGAHYTLQPFPIRPVPDRPIPLIVGGIGARATPRLAGRYADEFNAYPAAPDVFATKVDAMRKSAVDSGRDPDAIRLSSAGALLSAPTEVEYLDELKRVAEESGSPVEELEAYFEHLNTPRGSYEQVAEKLAELERAGVSRFYLQHGSDADREKDEALLAVLR
jgi:alkanesulfonate monooxygenase SsuD/methylene tetrahydromethanopterin reductase-like flavin-dependent oxidoreductase (luciferase family)